MRPLASQLADRVLQEQLGDVERLLHDVVGHCPPFHDQLFSPRSKRLRPALLLAVARGSDTAERDRLVRAAAGIELLHEATLYHDDIVDRAELRRGSLSVQCAFGARTAAYAGSELLYASAALFADLPPVLRRSAARAGERLCRGILRENEMLGQFDISERRRLRIMRDKTATDFVLAVRIGATLAGYSDGAIDELRRFALRFGLVFQLADDLRDLISEPELLGHARGVDLLNGVYSLPVLHALRADLSIAEPLRKVLIALRRADAATNVETAVGLIRRSGAVDAAKALLQHWVVDAECLLQGLPHSCATATALLAEMLCGVAAISVEETCA